jgi:hypothetical protein
LRDEHPGIEQTPSPAVAAAQNDRGWSARPARKPRGVQLTLRPKRPERPMRWM